MNSFRRRAGIALSLLAGTTVFAAPAMASDCAALARLKLPNGRITAATLVAPGMFTPPPSPFPAPPGVNAAIYKSLPSFCRVEARLAPTSDSDIKVEVWLPARGWNGKFVGVGNGIWAGQLSYFAMGEPLRRGYAVATTDTGHTGDGMSGKFALGHREKLEDFGWRAIHEMTVTAKRAILAHYGKPQSRAFWTSCSTGGRQGLMAAYRFPNDYDAISSMAPANEMTSLMTQTMWAGYQPNRAPGAALPFPKIAMLHRAVVAQCDADDGLKDAIIGRPDLCRFDPADLQCKEGDGETCLSAAQVQTVRALYQGVRASDGALILPGFPRGSEMQLGALISGPEPFPVATSYFRDLVHADNPGWDWKSFDWRADLKRGQDYGGKTLDVPFSGLAPFFARGGKLLLSHGWNDGLIPATNTLAFHAGLLQTTPRAVSDQQLRLFMVPGMDHCSGGEGAWQFDPLSTLEAWTASGTPPERIEAARPAGTPAGGALSRPICAWPRVARYGGSGDANDAANFACVDPA